LALQANASEGLRHLEDEENAIKIIGDCDRHLDGTASKLGSTWPLAAAGRPAAAAVLADLKAQRIADGELFIALRPRNSAAGVVNLKLDFLTPPGL
jgi:hypothetical protein